MKLVSHPSFSDRQQRLAAAILDAIAGELKKVDAPKEMVEELTGSIGFAVTSLIDDSASVEFGDDTLSPMLTFQVADEELAYAGGNTWMHEYVYRLLPEVLEQLDARERGPNEP
jgi:hypothetical protein